MDDKEQKALTLSEQLLLAQQMVAESYEEQVSGARSYSQEEVASLVRRYCGRHGTVLSAESEDALIEKIEDEFDLAEYEAAKKRYEDNPVSYSSGEVREKLGLK